jgi:hypothetical protein
VALLFAALHRSNHLALCRIHLPRARFAIDGAVSWIPFVLGFALPPILFLFAIGLRGLR